MPELSTIADVEEAWQSDDDPPAKRQKLEHLSSAGSKDDELRVAASAIAVCSFAGSNPDTRANTPLTDVPQKGSGFATPTLCQQVEIRQRPLIYPISEYEGWKPPMQPTKERRLVRELLQDECESDYLMVPASDFRVYRPQVKDRKPGDQSLEVELQEMDMSHSGVGASSQGKRGDHSKEMEPLHVLRGWHSCSSLLFDAVVTTARGKKYVEGVPFETLAIDAYDPDIPSAAEHISIQSRCATGTKVWYHLTGSPSPEYQRYHQGFLWVADLAKHTIAFMDQHEHVKLSDFEENFYRWLGQRYGSSAPGPVQDWLSKFPGRDFRKAVVAFSDFIWKECSSVNYTLCKEPFWQQINLVTKEISNPRNEAEEEPGTVVTPYVSRNFSHMPFGGFLAETGTSDVLKLPSARRKSAMGFFDAEEAQKIAESNNQTGPTVTKIEKGDCVAILPDEDSSCWKDGASKWYGYVQDIVRDRRGYRYYRFEILWLYEPQQTILSDRKTAKRQAQTVKYPYANELFLSDHCNCNHDDSPIKVEHIAHKVAVNFMIVGDAEKSKNDFQFFVRQKYNKREHSFVSLQISDFRCMCDSGQPILEEAIQKYKPGDVVLVPPPECWFKPESQARDFTIESKMPTGRQSGQLLEPVVIHKFGHPKEDTATVRRLLRRSRDLGDDLARPNELVWTYQFCKIPISDIFKSEARCHVRWFKEGHITAHKIPPPYDRDGTGNCWFLRSHIRDGHFTWETLDAPPAGLNQGWDPYEHPVRRPLKGLDLFCGGGNFGRGIAEGGAVEMTHAIDWNRHAVASYRANEPPGKEASVYQGSVNNYLKHAMHGHKNHWNFASIGDIDFIAAGSPCQGFSGLNDCKKNDQSLRNISMVASVAAYIDFYRPKYALLENVTAMAQSDVFPQLLCCIVGMGYQVSTSMVDAWTHGSPQHRSRLFVIISAPGLVPQCHPAPTHSHPPNKRSKSLGSSSADSTKFGERTFEPTPFKFVSASEAMDDLPWIGDGRLQMCISHPDHRTVSLEQVKYREMIHYIPISPSISSVIRAIHAQAMPKHIEDWWLHGSKRSEKQKVVGSNAYRRIDGDNLTWTISTTTNQADAKNGCILHWRQHRVLTILEARRAQSFPDHEVLIGSPAQQWAIVGNSVARTVALAFGMTLRESWLANAENQLPRLCVPIAVAEGPINYNRVEPSTNGRPAAAAAASSSEAETTVSIHQRTIKKRLVKRSSTSQQTRSTQYTQDTVHISRETTIQTTTSMVGPSRETQCEMSTANRDEENITAKEGAAQEVATVISLSDDTTEGEDNSVFHERAASSSNKVEIIDLTDDTSDESEPHPPKEEIKRDASSATRGPQPEVIDLPSTDDDEPLELQGWTQNGFLI